MTHEIASRDEWLASRLRLLAKEKELTRLRDRLSAERRALPWVEVDKTYVFDTPTGRRTLAELFDSRSQLIVKHFMLGPGWREGCVGCSFEVDHIEAAIVHLHNHDVTFVAVSSAPLPEILAFKERMGWHCEWVSSFGTDFNTDYHVSFTADEISRRRAYYNYTMSDIAIGELSGFSVFTKDESARIFHTYSAYGRGAEEVIGTYMLLDLTPKGRNETGPNSNLTDWVRHHDRYASAGSVESSARFRPSAAPSPCCTERPAG